MSREPERASVPILVVSMKTHLPLAIALVAGVGVSLISCRGLRAFACRHQLYSPSSPGRAGPGGVPLLGGVGVLLGLAAGWASALLALALLRVSPLPLLHWSAAAGALGIGFAAVGLGDDLRGLPPSVRLLAEMVVALIVLLCLRAPAGGGPGHRLPAALLDVLPPALGVVAGANALNLVDNADGLAASTGALTLIALALLFGPASAAAAGLLAAAGGGALLGVLYWNRPAARLYLGDTGSLPLGGLVAMILLRVGVPGVAHGSSSLSLLVAALMAGYLLFDPCYAVLGRLARGRAPWRGGTDHPSHDLRRAFGSWPPAWGAILAVHGVSVAAGLGLATGHLSVAILVASGALWLGLLMAALSGRARGRRAGSAP
jgi:UDP-GlcNAc:undecaprenyl-phosphate GlcNAc-1-phosphate transferase